MSSESLLENPGLFDYSNKSYFYESKYDTFRLQMMLCEEYIGQCFLYPPLSVSMGKGGSFNIIRSHLFKILYHYLSHSKDLRSQLANKNVNCLCYVTPILNELYERYEGWTADQWNAIYWHPWYRRHRHQD